MVGRPVPAGVCINRAAAPTVARPRPHAPRQDSARAPGRIGLHGVTRWVPKQDSPWCLLPIMTLVHVTVMYGLAAAADAGAAAGFNVPSKKRLLAHSREGRRYAIQPMRGFLYGLATWVIVLTGYIQVRFYAFALGDRNGDGSTWGMLAFVAAMLTFVLFMGFRVSRIVARRIEKWEQAEGVPATRSA
jgi:hypothetical protein